jgi:hypothetical protein
MILRTAQHWNRPPNNYQGGSLASIMLYSKTQFSISHIGSQIQNIEKPATGGSLKIQLIAEHWFFLYSLDIDQQTTHIKKMHWLLYSVLATKKNP